MDGCILSYSVLSGNFHVCAHVCAHVYPLMCAYLCYVQVHMCVFLCVRVLLLYAVTPPLLTTLTFIFFLMQIWGIELRFPCFQGKHFTKGASFLVLHWSFYTDSYSVISVC